MPQLQHEGLQVLIDIMHYMGRGITYTCIYKVYMNTSLSAVLEYMYMHIIVFVLYIYMYIYKHIHVYSVHVGNENVVSGE